jgi:branched-chain amino acid transport system ATP-binding protein
MLEVKDLKVAYGRVMAVKGISFKVDQGQVVTLLGTNGAGKTTTLRTISGLIRPESGEIWFEGDRIDATPAHQVLMRGVAHSPEGRKIFPRLTVEENLMLGPKRRGAGSGTSLQSLRHLAGEAFPAGRYVLRRRAADAGDRPSDDESA